MPSFSRRCTCHTKAGIVIEINVYILDVHNTENIHTAVHVQYMYTGGVWDKSTGGLYYVKLLEGVVMVAQQQSKEAK
jgi:hypothetical protein